MGFGFYAMWRPSSVSDRHHHLVKLARVAPSPPRQEDGTHLALSRRSILLDSPAPACIGWEQGKRSRYDASDTLDASRVHALRLTPLPTSPHGLRRQARHKRPNQPKPTPTHPNHTNATSADPTTATPWERDVVGGRARRGTHSVISNTWTEVGPSTSPLAPHPSPLAPL